MLWEEEGVLVAPVAKKRNFVLNLFIIQKKYFFWVEEKYEMMYKEKAIKIYVAFVNVFVVRESL